MSRPLRKLTGVERKHARAMAGSLLFGGEHKDDVVAEVTGWLVEHGWSRAAAIFRAREVVLVAQADPSTWAAVRP